MATYEGRRFIESQLKSILPQLSKEDEVVISDDASSDETVLVIGQVNDARIKILRNNHRVGYIKNFERALAHARGDYIFFSDQDDVWLNNKVITISSALDRKACAASDAIVVDQDLRVLMRSFFESRKASSFSAFAIFLKPSLIGATMACRRSYLDGLLPFPSDVPHDFWITLNAAWDHELEVIDQPLILYRRHDATASVSATSLKRPFLVILKERMSIAAVLLSRRGGKFFRQLFDLG